jgi:hypothetical protein
MIIVYIKQFVLIINQILIQFLIIPKRMKYEFLKII